MANIKVSNFVKDKIISKKSNGVNIFNAMKSEYNKDNTIRSFTLDMSGINFVKPYVFQEIVHQMQTRLNGEFRIELVNANHMTASSFKTIFK